MITDYSPIVDENHTIIKSKEEFLNYEPEIYKQDNYYEEFNYKEFKIFLEKFNDYNLIVSSNLMSGYAAFVYQYLHGLSYNHNKRFQLINYRLKGTAFFLFQKDTFLFLNLYMQLMQLLNLIKQIVLHCFSS